MTPLQALESKIFKSIHQGNLVYNTCWEDPRCDREILKIQPESELVVLTSAGCNVLDYLIDNPSAIHAVDLNPRQNALLDLKKALFLSGNFQVLYQWFGQGTGFKTREFYKEHLRPWIANPEAQKFWDKQVQRYFEHKGLRKSFYWKGSSGTVAWMVKQWMRSKSGLATMVKNLLDAPTLEAQEHAYNQFEPKFMNPFMKWFLGRHVVQSMLGVPKSQQQLAKENYEEGMAGYMKSCMRHVFTKVPVNDNYFWNVYFYGFYPPGCEPNYLKQENFNLLRSRVARVETYTHSLTGFLRDFPGNYSHYVLLDHQDWLATHDFAELETEWKLIFENSRPGTRILMRSAASDLGFLPQWVHEKLEFDQAAALWSHNNDRVGTYASTHIGIVK
jgi:S-adenosylmethionine-diacylglycerol 3-amino-3-carboxypropyl transferase